MTTDTTDVPIPENFEPRRDEENATMTPRVEKRADPAAGRPSVEMSSDMLETLNRLADFGRAHLETLSQTSHTMLQCGVQCQQVMMAFADQRMQRRYRLFEEAQSLTDPTDAFRLQADFGRGLVEDTFRMIEDLAGVGERLASENLACLQESTTATISTFKRKLDEVA